MGSVDLIASCRDSICQVRSLRHFVLIPGLCLFAPISFVRHSTKFQLLSRGIRAVSTTLLWHLVMRICAVQRLSDKCA